MSPVVRASAPTAATLEASSAPTRSSVCHISTVHALRDGRIFYKECRALREAGYRVSLVIQHDRQEERDGISIVPLPPTASRLKRVLLNVPRAVVQALRTRARVCHFHDPELIFAGVLLRLCGRTVVYDSHEDVEMQIYSKAWIGSPAVRKLVSRVFRLAERFCCLFFNRVVSATPHIAEKFPPAKRVLVRNFPYLSGLQAQARPSAAERTTKRIIYAGALTKIRGISETIQALGAIDAAELWLVGEWETEDYRRHCMSLPEWRKVTYLGTKELPEVYALLGQADIGIALLYPEANYFLSLPTKAFEYMAAGLPILMSDMPFWREQFAGAALFANPFDREDIARQLNRLVNDRALYAELAQRGQSLVRELSWEGERRHLLDMYAQLLDHRGRE